MPDISPRNIIYAQFRKSDRQGERQPESYSARLADQMKRTKASLDSGLSVAEVRRYERARSLGIIKREAEALALFETPASAAEVLRSVADEIAGGDPA